MLLALGTALVAAVLSQVLENRWLISIFSLAYLISMGVFAYGLLNMFWLQGIVLTIQISLVLGAVALCVAVTEAAKRRKAAQILDKLNPFQMAEAK